MLPDSLSAHLKEMERLDVWSFPEFARYLRAILLKLTPQPHHCAQAVLDALTVALATRPVDCLSLRTTPPGAGIAAAARQVANIICEVLTLWAQDVDQIPIKYAHGPSRHDMARGAVRGIEKMVLRSDATERRFVGLDDSVMLTMEQLAECAIDAFGTAPDANHRDAAVAAYTAGNATLAKDIVTDGDRTPN